MENRVFWGFLYWIVWWISAFMIRVSLAVKYFWNRVSFSFCPLREFRLSSVFCSRPKDNECINYGYMIDGFWNWVSLFTILREFRSILCVIVGLKRLCSLTMDLSQISPPPDACLDLCVGGEQTFWNWVSPFFASGENLDSVFQFP